MTPDAIEALRRGAETPARATLADLDALAEDLSASFAKDPQFDWFMRDDARRPAARLAFFRMILKNIALKDGEVTRPAAGGAAAIWLPSESLGPNPILTELMVLPTILGATGFGRFSRLLAMRKAMDEFHPMDRPHAYLWFLGVRPEAQGMGVGSRMLAAGLAKVDALGLPAFLESSNIANVPLYQRYGFEVVREYRPGEGAPPIWAMWRDARPGG
ncbi:GNAT family N-acetyltransferase [Phenylobacterium aquaticum]|uniref:GNAT family N-acetyltransferase n=1 Tax=Phenylobacterium aquaticum TaxID=1763816 RepID=UPI001F5DCA31|nr:GNAT family N-acetyltransferase [Phenylobacterium aquaticum]MCI3131249.1 GNAT family N-acetyltransferase [Phenylobacterium aquaticum]